MGIEAARARSCHAGGRGFESRRSRLRKALQIGCFLVGCGAFFVWAWGPVAICPVRAIEGAHGRTRPRLGFPDVIVVRERDAEKCGDVAVA